MLKYLRIGILSIVIFILPGRADTPRSLYVLNNLGRSLSMMELRSGQIQNNVITVGDVPNKIYSKDGKIYVVNSTPASITIIDGSNKQILRTINLAEGSNPWDMAFVGAGRAYVSNLLANSITILDLAIGDSLGSISVGNAPEDILVVNNTAYVANSGGYPGYTPSTVSVIDILNDMVTKTLDVPANPQALALAPDGTVHVVCTGNYADQSGRVAIIDPYADTDYTPLVTDTIAIGGTPGDIAITPAGKAYLSDWGNGTNGFLYSYNVFSDSINHGVSNPLPVGNGASGLLYDSRENILWIANFADDNVQRYDVYGDTVLNTYGFGDGAQQMAILEAIRTTDAWADSVVAFVPGGGAGFGENYFPQNVLGPPDPDPTLTEFNSSSKPQEILSLGAGGTITLTFIDNYIYNGAGPDFTVFENAFLQFGNGEPFIEAAYVDVSQDGQTWYRFPWDTTTWKGFAGVTPMKDNQHPSDPSISGGDSFDLDSLGLEWVRYVRLTDIDTLKKEGQWNGDFDLDAVVAVNSKSGSPTAIDAEKNLTPLSFELKQNYPNPFNPSTLIRYHLQHGAQVNLSVYDVSGQRVQTLVNGWLNAGEQQTRFEANDLASGIYYYRLTANGKGLSRRMLLLK